MTILTAKTCWHRQRPVWDTENPERLTAAQEENVRSAIRFLKVRLGGWPKLGKAMGVKPQTLDQAVNRKRRAPNAGMAIRAARVACVPVERILSGIYPPKGMCPHCGRMGSGWFWKSVTRCAA